MSPRNSASGAVETRDLIVGHALDVVASDGFEAASLGRLAADLSMSKAGVIGHFKTMEGLHLAAVQAAVELFTREVWAPVAHMKPGLPRLRKLCGLWIDYLCSKSYVGGCFTSGEFHRSETVRAAVARAVFTWQQVLAGDIRSAQVAGQVSKRVDAQDLAFALNGVAVATGQALRLGIDDKAPQRARVLIRRTLREASAR